MRHESELIDWIRTQQRPGGDVVLPAGDDLAILRVPPSDLILVGIDQVLDGVHFDATKHAPELIGRKAMNRNLSDCAAMACLPVSAVVSFALPLGISIEFVKAIYLGLKEAGEAFECPIVGGDTGAWNGKLAISVSIVGRSAGVTPIWRQGAKPGDSIYVTGPLGGSILGRHLSFQPRVHEARALAQRYPITAMIDISDGLSRDLAHICRESGVGAMLEAVRIPIHEDVKGLDDDRSPLDHALSDGEDYELCFTSPAEISEAIRIGVITADTELWIEDGTQRVSLQRGGFEHTF